MLRKIKKSVKRFLACTVGLETTEYAIIVGLVVAATLATLAAIGAWVLQQYQAAQGAVGA